MHNREYVDIGRVLDRIFQAAENLGDAFETNFSRQFRHGHESRDFYNAYGFPPANIYVVNDRTMVFEFALSGYRESDVTLEFKGEHMVLNASPPPNTVETDEVIYFNRRLKYKRVVDQKYLVPSDKYDREGAKAVFKNGILQVTIPPREEIRSEPGVKIEIESETSQEASE